MERKFEWFVIVSALGEIVTIYPDEMDAKDILSARYAGTLHRATIILGPEITPASVEEDRVRRDERKRIFEEIRRTMRDRKLPVQSATEFEVAANVLDTVHAILDAVERGDA